MGFFSWKCKVCGKSIVAPGGKDDPIAWMNKAVAIMPRGQIVAGDYDGYGRICDAELVDDFPAMYHRRCWEAVGKPMEYHGESASADDQGLGDEEHFYISNEAWKAKVKAYLAKHPLNAHAQEGAR